MDFERDHDARIRAATFEWLARQAGVYVDAFPRDILERGFEIEGQRVSLMSPKGIHKPHQMQVPISITTSPKSSYDDGIGIDNLIHYRYRGEDPYHPDNMGLRFAMHNELPLVYCYGIMPNRYVVMWPVYVVHDAPQKLTFSVAVDDPTHADILSRPVSGVGAIAEARRLYVTSLTRQRLHQSAFRERVLRAYRYQCAFCRLRHTELLDAAHIIPDSDPKGEPIVSNGIALCRLHHAAFDKFFLGVRPDRIIEVRGDVLEECDGPTLQHAIQGLHGQTIVLPRKVAERPAPEFLTDRYEKFLEVAGTR